MLKTIIIIIILLGCYATAGYGQKAEVEKAIKNNNFSEYQYTVTLKDNKMIDPDRLITWFNKNTDKYYLTNYALERKWFAGSTRSLISSFSFVKVADFQKYTSLQAEKIQQQATEAKYRVTTMDIIAMGASAALLGMAINCASTIISNARESRANYQPGVSYSSSNSSSSSCTFKLEEWNSTDNYAIYEIRKSSGNFCKSYKVGWEIVGNEYWIKERGGGDWGEYNPDKKKVSFGIGGWENETITSLEKAIEFFIKNSYCCK